MDRFWAKVDKSAPNGCWEWTAYKLSDGYGVFRNDGKIMRAHRTSWIMANGSIPDGVCVLHSCDNPSCVNPGHLWLGSRQDNMDDKVKKDRTWKPKGEKHHMVKLTDEKVTEIKYLLSLDKYTSRQIAKSFCISPSTIRNIKCGLRWSHI